MSAEEFQRLSGEVIGAAIEVHRILGPGLLESAYEECLAWELTHRFESAKTACYTGALQGTQN